MSTAPAAKPSAEKRFLTFLEHVGHDIDQGFQKAAPVIQAAEPYINVIFPGFGPLFASTVNTIVGVEQKFAAVGKQTGSGEEKLAEVLADIEPIASELLGQAGLPNDGATVTKWVNAVVGFLNGIPTSVPAPAPAPAPPAASAPDAPTAPSTPTPSA